MTTNSESKRLASLKGADERELVTELRAMIAYAEQGFAVSLLADAESALLEKAAAFIERSANFESQIQQLHRLNNALVEDKVALEKKLHGLRRSASSESAERYREALVDIANIAADHGMAWLVNRCGKALTGSASTGETG